MLPLLLIPDAKGKDVLLSDPGAGRTMMSPSCRNSRLLTACRSPEVGATLPLILIPDAKGKEVLLVLLSDPGAGRTMMSPS